MNRFAIEEDYFRRPWIVMIFMQIQICFNINASTNQHLSPHLIVSINNVLIKVLLSYIRRL